MEQSFEPGFFLIIKAKTHVDRVKRPFQIPDPYAMTISDVTNLRCINSGGIKMSNTIKLHGNLLPKNGNIIEVKPLKHKILNYKG